MSAPAKDPAAIESAQGLSAEAHQALRTLLLTLADNKRLLGIRYSDWMLGAPSLETGIAASSMAQDEWGHGRLTYALLSDFGDDPKRLEHEREAEAYHSMELLDRPFSSWAEMIAASLLIDSALGEQYRALLESRYAPVHNRVQKLLDEEEYHFQYATGWAQRFSTTPELRAIFLEALQRLLPVALRWLGCPDAEDIQLLSSEGLVREGADGLRQRLLEKVGPLLEEIGLAGDLGLARRNGGWSFAAGLDWQGWDDARRRGTGGGPDAETLARVRGDKNKAMLLD